MTTDGSQQNHIEFLKCVTVVTFTEVLRIVADWMWDFDLFVNFVYQILSLGIFLDENHKVQRTAQGINGLLFCADLCGNSITSNWT